MNIFFSLLLLILIIAAGTSAFAAVAYQSSFKQKGFTYSVGPCLGSSPRSTDLEAKREVDPEQTLYITKPIVLNCNDKVIGAKLEDTNPSLNITYYIDDPKSVKAKCTCEHELRATIVSQTLDVPIKFQSESSWFLTLGYLVTQKVGTIL